MNPNKFFELLMNNCWHEWEWKPKDGDIHIYECKCGLRVGGRPQNPDYLSNPLPIIRFMEKEMPEEWHLYCTNMKCEFGLPWVFIEKILDLSNLVTYLVQNPGWAETPCPNSSAHCKDYCDGSPCNGSGLIVHPALKYARDNKEEG